MDMLHAVAHSCSEGCCCCWKNDDGSEGIVIAGRYGRRLGDVFLLWQESSSPDCMTDLSVWMACVREFSSSRVRRRLDCEEEDAGVMPNEMLLLPLLLLLDFFLFFME